MKKLIFMLLSPIWVIVEDLNRKFEHFVHETWPQTCDRIDFKFYKKQMKSENYEICHDNMISYVESVIKNWEGFCKSCDVCWLWNEVPRRSLIELCRIR